MPNKVSVLARVALPERFPPFAPNLHSVRTLTAASLASSRWRIYACTVGKGPHRLHCCVPVHTPIVDSATDALGSGVAVAVDTRRRLFDDDRLVGDDFDRVRLDRGAATPDSSPTGGDRCCCHTAVSKISMVASRRSWQVKCATQHGSVDSPPPLTTAAPL
jgi:hypothetical protein